MHTPAVQRHSNLVLRPGAVRAWMLVLLWVGSNAQVGAQSATEVPAIERTRASGWDGGGSASRDGVGVSGYLQVDAVPWMQASADELDPGSGAPLNQDSFSIPRSRLRLAARHGLVSGSVVLDANTLRGMSVGLFTAEGALSYPGPEMPVLEGGAGLFLIPFGFETTEQANRRLFLEPSTWVGALFPGRRDLGARLGGDWSFLRYTFAVMNGEPVGGASFPGRDPNRAKDLLGRVILRGALGARVSVEVGASALFGKGFHAGAPATKDAFVVRDGNEDGMVQSTEIQLVSGNPAEPSRSFDHHGLGAQFALTVLTPVLGSGRLYGEWVSAQNLDRGLWVADPLAQGRNVRELGFMLALRQELTRHAELGVRFDYYDPDQDASEQQPLRVVTKDASFSTWGVAAAWCSLPFARLTAQYDHRDNPLGRTRKGTPTTLAMDSLTLRLQVELQ